MEGSWVVRDPGSSGPDSVAPHLLKSQDAAPKTFLQMLWLIANSYSCNTDLSPTYSPSSSQTGKQHKPATDTILLQSKSCAFWSMFAAAVRQVLLWRQKVYLWAPLNRLNPSNASGEKCKEHFTSFLSSTGESCKTNITYHVISRTTRVLESNHWTKVHAK